MWDQPERGDTEMSQQVGDKTQKEKDAFVQRLEEELVAYHNRGLQIAALPAIEQRQAIDKALAEAPRFTKLIVGAYPSAVSRGLMEAYIETAIRPLIIAVCRAAAMPEGAPLPEVMNPLSGKPIMVKRIPGGVEGTVESPWPESAKPLHLRLVFANEGPATAKLSQ